MEVMYNRFPKKVQDKVPAMRRVAERSREQRMEKSLHSSTNDDRATLSTEPYYPCECVINGRMTRSRAPKHWFDNDADDRSDHSSDGETTITGKEEKEVYV